VITIVIVTAIPYAAASALDDPKPMTIKMVATINAQFDLRDVDLPISCDDVCSMSRRGAYPSWIACCVSENAPEISACEAMIAAASRCPPAGRGP
jgi:hypothetical protein